ncbi:MAG: hypothetical protein AABZ55_06665 [Bdellovibrionota bacterium]
MKVFSISRIAIALAVATAVTISGCGTNNGAPLPGGYGSPGMPGYPGYGGGGCLPVNMPIGFTASGVQMSSIYWNAGMVPGYAPSGTVVIGGGAVTQPPVYGGVGQLQGAGISGSVTISVNSGQYGQPQPYPGQPYPQTYPYGGGMTTMTGTVSISQIEQQSIMYEAQSGAYGGYNPYGTGYPTTGYPTTQPYPGTYPGSVPMPGMPQSGMVCVSNIAIGNAHVYGSGLPNLAADVYLYMNNTQHGHVLHFY